MTSRTLALVLSTLLSIGIGSSAFAFNEDLPELGASADSVLSPAQQRDLGQAFMRSIRQSERVITDPLVVDYIHRLGKRLVGHSAAAGQHFSFFVIDNPEINAFAGPDGYIGVYTGLILTTQTESELAAVMAHEIAHVQQKHLLRAWESAQNMSLPGAALLLAAIALGATTGGNSGIALAAGTQAALLQHQINFTRANEEEADRIGMQILEKSQFQPRAMAAFFSRMGKATRIYDTKLPELLQTHPVTTSRIADALERADAYPYRQPKDDLRYELVRMYLQQRAEPNPNVAVSDFDRMLRDGRYRNRMATEYGRIRALMRADHPGQAEKAIDALLAKRPDQIEFIITKAQLEGARGAAGAALKRLDQALLDRPGSYALNVSYAQIALANGKYQAVLSRLKDYVSYDQDDPQLYALLSRAAGEAGDTVQAHLYQSQYHYLNGDLEAAVRQLDIALKTPGIRFFQKARVEARLDALKAEQKDQKDRE